MNRHYLIYLQPDDAFHFLDSSLALPVQQKIQQMIERNMPFTVCRQDTEDYFKVAASCFFHGRKYRVALGLTSAPVLSHRPLPLAVISTSFNTDIQNILQQFIQQMEDLSCSVHVYGSYACEHLYQEKFVHAESDLDLLIECGNTAEIAQVLQSIEQLKTQLPIRIDGELTLKNSQNISFNELIFAINHKQDNIIVKELNGISLLNIAEIFGGKLHELQQYSNCPA